MLAEAKCSSWQNYLCQVLTTRCSLNTNKEFDPSVRKEFYCRSQLWWGIWSQEEMIFFPPRSYRAIKIKAKLNTQLLLYVQGSIPVSCEIFFLLDFILCFKLELFDFSICCLLRMSIRLQELKTSERITVRWGKKTLEILTNRCKSCCFLSMVREFFYKGVIIKIWMY